MTDANQCLANTFIERWSDCEGGQERANYSLFLTEFCDIIGVSHPDPASASHEFNDYVFERRVERKLADGAIESGRIDLYKRGHFLLEAKQSRRRACRTASLQAQGDLFAAPTQETTHYAGTLDHLMIQARRQAERYAAALPVDHPYPPFLIICDIGRAFELFADFSGHGRHYAQFPDTRQFRINLTQLADPEVRKLLWTVWEDPQSLDPAQQTAKVTREIAGQLAIISKALEDRGFEARSVAIFLMRCLFTMFVEDVGLLPKDEFTKLLNRCLEHPKYFTHDINDLWHYMDRGGYSPSVGAHILHFNGGLFKNATALPLTIDEIKLLRDASNADWGELEPAIFGTLFEQALDPAERKRLGAHYTPRSYVERLVNETIIEPLTHDWIKSQSAADRALQKGAKAEAIQEIQDFLSLLSSIRVLDPACGTGNFLYVSLRQMKRLEGEALKQLHDIAGDDAVRRVEQLTVKPEQFFGLEINRRAVEIAELVLWIGYIQWHLRTRPTDIPQPVLGSSNHVRELDALLTWDGYPNRELKRHLGLPVADSQGRETYVFPNARQPDWPPADFIVGNPPFIGGKDIRGRLGADYAAALWAAHPHINPSADFVMYWWDRAAELLTLKDTRLRRFGLVTTNSIIQMFQRRVLEKHLSAARPISLLFAIPDHPWTRATKDSASVRIAMTVAGAGEHEGILQTVVHEEALDTDEPRIVFESKQGRINPDLTSGQDTTKCTALVANDALCSRGVSLHGDGFIVSREKAIELGLGRRHGLENHIRAYRNGRDLTARSRDVMVIDMFGLSAESVRRDFPEVYQHLLETVKRQRTAAFEKSGTRDSREYLNHWWQFGKPRSELRPALEGLPRYIVTAETMRHRIFQFLDGDILPDNKLIVLALDSAFILGVVSSKIHIIWATHSGGWLGVGNDSVYVKSRCFDPFPFPDTTAAAKTRISALADELDETRKIVLGENPDISLTMLYNTLAACREGRCLSKKEQNVQTRGRILILKELHDQLDEQILRAYGWPDDITDEKILENLVALNQARTAEERRGFIKWLRPQYQVDKLGPLAHRADRVQSIAIAGSPKKPSFPMDRKEQASCVLDIFLRNSAPLTTDQLASKFKDGNEAKLQIHEVLTSLSRLGEIETFDDGLSYIRIAS